MRGVVDGLFLFLGWYKADNQFAILLLTPDFQSGVVRLSASAPLSHHENSRNI
ncbi:MAG: hypothetical protein KDD67_06605 [Ignavibacteriae bacterium]|nr:hypothetical protein [Ignavibacteriota bacterium]MCB9215607.1 hypothetical protein [Ignavibacteria bacterium]